MYERLDTGDSAMISIIIPVYNVEPFLRKCLDRVVNQTYTDLEILIIDDGCTDRSGSICDEYAAVEKEYGSSTRRTED